MVKFFENIKNAWNKIKKRREVKIMPLHERMVLREMVESINDKQFHLNNGIQTKFEIYEVFLKKVKKILNQTDKTIDVAFSNTVQLIWEEIYGEKPTLIKLNIDTLIKEVSKRKNNPTIYNKLVHYEKIKSEAGVKSLNELISSLVIERGTPLAQQLRDLSDTQLKKCKEIIEELAGNKSSFGKNQQEVISKVNAMIAKTIEDRKKLLETKH